jgi:hypothetical protein
VIATLLRNDERSRKIINSVSMEHLKESSGQLKFDFNPNYRVPQLIMMRKLVVERSWGTRFGEKRWGGWRAGDVPIFLL